MIATVVVTLFGADFPAGFWDDRRAWFAVAVIVLALSGAKSVIGGFLGRRSMMEERRIQDALKTAYVRIVETSGIDYRDVGLHAFLLRRDPLRPWRRRLVGVARWRLMSTSPITAIDWMRGKGLIGRCWDMERNVGANLAEEWGPEELSEDEWSDLADEYRYGFSYDEYVKVQDFGAIVAVPIIDGQSRFVGCVSADAPGETFDQLWHQDVLAYLHDAGLSIRDRSDTN